MDLGAFFALAGALSYSELGVNFPASGGEYVYLTRAYGPTWGFITAGYRSSRAFPPPSPPRHWLFPTISATFFPSFRQSSASLVVGSGAFSITLGGGQAMACVLIAAFTALNLFGVERVARVQNLLTATKLAVIVGFLVLGFGAGTGSWSNFSLPAARTATTTLPVQLVISLAWVMVAYSGWNAATYVAEELRRPERTLAAALAVGTTLVAALFLA